MTNKNTYDDSVEHRPILGYEGLYQVSADGRIYSYYCNRYLRDRYSTTGYSQVVLTRDGQKKQFLVHRLVAQAFIPNPQGLPEINHKNENKKDNRKENLEWCDHSYNTAYGTAPDRRIQAQGFMVSQYNLKGYWIASYRSLREAGRQTGISHARISKVLSGEAMTAGGYIWKKENLRLENCN